MVSLSVCLSHLKAKICLLQTCRILKKTFTVSDPGYSGLVITILNFFQYLFLVIVPFRHTQNCSTWGNMTAWNTPRLKILELKMNHQLSKWGSQDEHHWKEIGKMVKYPLNNSKHMTYLWLLQLLCLAVVSLVCVLFRTSPGIRCNYWICKRFVKDLF